MKGSKLDNKGPSRMEISPFCLVLSLFWKNRLYIWGHFVLRDLHGKGSIVGENMLARMQEALFAWF